MTGPSRPTAPDPSVDPLDPPDPGDAGDGEAEAGVDASDRPRSVAATGARFRAWNRRRKFAQAQRLIRREGIRSVLMVGVAGTRDGYGNQIERAIAGEVDRAVWSGLGDVRVDECYVRADALALPFPDKAFDLVFSNAVIEHVGGRDEQLRFMLEHDRVGVHWFITTPNRRFPVESHTNAVLRHWSARWRAGRPEFTRLMTRGEFRALLPRRATVEGSPLSPTFSAWT